MANITVGKPGPNAALTLIMLWLEGKQEASYADLCEWEAIVINALTTFEHRMDRRFGSGEMPSFTDPSET